MSLPVLLTLWLASAPADAADVVLVSDMTTVHTAAPGQQIRGTLTVRNTGSEAEQVTLSLQDYSTRSPSTRDLTPPGTLDRSLASWLTLESESVRIAPGEIRELSYDIAVPDSAGLAGSYWSVVMIEETPEPADASGSISILQRSRIATRVVVDVSGGTRLVSFVASGLAQDGDDIALYTDIENTGTSMLAITPKVELYQQDGSRQGVYQSEPVSLYPDCSWRYTVAMPNVPAGDYTAIVVADGGDGALFGARHPVRIE